MKSWFNLAFIGFLLVCSTNFSVASDVSTPRYVTDWMVAAGLYNTGLKQVQAEPGKAVQSFQDAQKHVKLAIAEGADYRINDLSLMIGKALIIAQNRAKDQTSQTASSQTGSNRSTTPRTAPSIHAKPLSHSRQVARPQKTS